MKRDMELIRKMVLAVEDAPTGFAPHPLKIAGYTEEQVGYHAYLMVDHGLAEATRVTTLASEGPQWVLRHLTSEGHDYAAAARDATTWRKAMSVVQEKGGAVTLDVVKALLSHLAKAGLDLLV